MDRTKIINFGNLELLAKQVVEGTITGMHKSPFHGFSVEFAEHRIYNQGESIRHIDWKLYGRTDRMYSKKYEEETNLRCQMLVDISSSMFFPVEKEETKIRHAIYSVASLIELLKRQRDAFGVTFFSDKIHLHTEAKSTPSHQRFAYSEMEKYMDNYNPKNQLGTKLSSILHEVSELIHSRSLVMIFTDFWSEEENISDFVAALNHLKHEKHEVIIFHLYSKEWELDFLLDNRPYQMIDMETGEELRILPNDYRNNYKKNVENYLNEIKLKCGDYAVDFVPIAIEDDYQQILIQYLIKRQKMMK